MSEDPRAFFEELIRAMTALDKDVLRRVVHPEFVGFFPQSGEITRGFDQFVAGLEQYPGGPPDDGGVTDMRLVDDEERWVITPAYTVVPLANPGLFTVVGRSKYPDGSLWHIVMSVELHAGQLYRTEVYFAPEMPAPLLEALVSASAEAQ